MPRTGLQYLQQSVKSDKKGRLRLLAEDQCCITPAKGHKAHFRDSIEGENTPEHKFLGEMA